MRFLENFVETPIAGAIGWTLLHTLWEGAIVSAVLAAVLLAVRSPRVRYAAACAATLVMLAGFGLTLFWLLPDEASGARNVQARVPYLANLSSVSGTADRWVPGLVAIVPWLGPFWIAGVCLFCLWYLASWVSVERMRRRGVCCAADRWQRELARLGAQLRVSRPVLLLESCFAAAPVVLDHFRPLILMPIGRLAGLPPAHVEAVLVHELAHIRRHDYLMNLLQQVVEGLLFYHPEVWWFSRVMRNEREKCCDDVVVSVTGQAHEYALALVALEQNRFSGRLPPIAVSGGNLMKRIHRLLYPKPSSASWGPLLALAIFLATAGLSLAAWPSEPSKESPTASQSQAGSAATSSYSKWLNEDVVYIEGLGDNEFITFIDRTGRGDYRLAPGNAH